jgi:uncharacterized membrane protein
MVHGRLQGAAGGAASAAEVISDIQGVVGIIQGIVGKQSMEQQSLDQQRPGWLSRPS